MNKQNYFNIYVFFTWGLFINMKQIMQIKHNGVKDCQIVEANQFAIYKRVPRICPRDYNREDLRSTAPVCSKGIHP